MSERKIRNMEEFASVSGISRPTISKYFNDPESVRQSTRVRIEEALSRYDYRPNIFAVNQNRKLTKNIGIVVPYLADPFFAEIARNLEERCITAGLRPILYSAHGSREMEVEILNDLRTLKPAGVLIAPLGRASDRAAIEKFSADVPTVLFDSSLEGVGIAFIGSDMPNFSMQMVDYLCRTGEPPCLLEMRTPANPNSNKRRMAYIAAMETLGHEPQVVQIEGEGWAFEEIGRQGGGQALSSRAFKTNTILCSNDRLAIGLLTASYELGFKVGIKPDCDIRVAGQDDHPLARYTCPPLTTVAQDYNAISERAVETLISAIEGQSTDLRSKWFPGRLIMRQSA